MNTYKHRKGLCWHVFSLFIVLSLLLSCCVTSSAEQFKNATTVTVWGNTEITIDPVADDGKWFESLSFTTEWGIPIAVTSIPGYQILINGEEVKGDGAVTVKADLLSHDVGIPITFIEKGTAKKTTSYIRTLPLAIDVYTFGSSNEAGYYLFNQNSYNIKMDTDGNIVYYCAASKANDFKAQIVNGKLYYTCLTNTQPTFDAGSMKATALVFNSTYELIDTVEYLLTEDGAPSTAGLDNHEFVMLGENHYILTSYVIKRVTNIPENVNGYSPFGSRVVASIFQEIKDGELLFQWDSTEHPELYGMSIDGNDFLNATSYYADYAHINSVTIDPADGNYIVSLRNTATILKISKSTGGILWILGGNADEFGLTDEQKTSAQHHARVTNRGTITVFDNGLVLPEGTPNPFGDEYNTRVVEYKLDEVNKKLIAFQEYVVPGCNSPIMGSAQLLDSASNTFLVGWGGRRPGTALFSEVDFNSKAVIFECYSKGTSILDGSYRVYKLTMAELEKLKK